MSGIDFNTFLQGAADFTGGFFNALGSDEVVGVGRQEQPTPAGKVGATFGDATATIQGLFEFTQGVGGIGAGFAGEAIGFGLDATGIGAGLGVPVGIVSAGLILAGSGLAVHGGAVGLTGAAHLATDTVQLTHLAMADANKPANYRQYVTRPTGKPGDKPTGTRTTNNRDVGPNNKRGIELENQSADILADAGYKVEQNPKVPGDKNPDYRIEGQIFDNYAPQPETDAKGVVDGINRKVGKGQAERIVLNMTDDPGVTRQQIRDALKDYRDSRLKEVIMIDQHGNITHLFP